MVAVRTQHSLRLTTSPEITTAPLLRLSRRQFLTRAAALCASIGAANLPFDVTTAKTLSTHSATSSLSLPTTITEAAQQLRSGTISCVALTKAYLERIKQLDPKLNAFITLTDEAALAAAAQLDAELASGHDRGPLHGIPIVHKDIFDTAGVRTTVGSRFFEHRVPSEDATVVQRLRAAGAISLGKTNMNEFAAGVSGTNAFFGDTHNPWDLDRSPGGSSSGTGAAVAAGLCLGGTGTDTGGSIRVPASWCGIVGLRPTYGLVSLAGAFPRAYSLDTAGPLARSVTDVALLLDAMAGYDPRDPNSALAQQRRSYTEQLDRGVAGMRLGIVDNYTFRDIESDIEQAIRSAADKFADLGAEIVNVRIPALSGPLEYSALFNILLFEFNQILGDEYRAAADPTVFGPIVRANLEAGSMIPAEVYEAAKRERPAQIAQVKAVFNDVDALLVPTMPMTAPLLTASSDVYDRGRQFTLPFSFTALPSISVPCGLSTNRLPVGLQIVGNHFEEATILRIAAAFEAATDWHTYYPPL
jgi:aspartyl-tRNA(Asn)/glutamyl-tRNA(Gln) amidotransferase subunit A